METQTVTLAEFLLARIAEDEARRWQVHDGECETWAGVHGLPDATFRAQMPQAVCDCPVPSRVLAECEAKRRIVDLLAGARFALDCHPDDEGEQGHVNGIEKAVALLALPYADHPDYREEWRP